tara:strand:- start:3658 stop:3858 length:201 start_codon:yes stop_codon:yes gene_type:complete
MLTDFYKYVVSFFEKGGSSEIHPVKDTEIFEPSLEPIKEDEPIKEEVEEEEKRAENELEHCFLTFF